MFSAAKVQLLLSLFLTVAAKKYFESRVRLSKGTTPTEQKKKREVARRAKVNNFL